MRVRSRQIWGLFHRLWTKATHTNRYDKKEWLQLEKILLQLGVENTMRKHEEIVTMTHKEYLAGVLQTESNDAAAIEARLLKSIRLLHAIMGIVTEAGELTDALKKHLFYGKELDRINILEELGDLMYYFSLAVNTIGSSLEEVMRTNHDKLAARYKSGFTVEETIQRNLEAERKALEKK